MTSSLTSFRSILYYSLPQGVEKPRRGTAYSAGLDIFMSETVELCAREEALINLKIRVRLPPGFFGQLALRSGVLKKFRLTIHGGIIG